MKMIVQQSQDGAVALELIHERYVKAVGHEVTIPMQVFLGKSMAWSMNTSWNKNIYQVEVLNQLDQVPAVGADFDRFPSRSLPSYHKQRKKAKTDVAFGFVFLIRNYFRYHLIFI